MPPSVQLLCLQVTETDISRQADNLSRSERRRVRQLLKRRRVARGNLHSREQRQQRHESCLRAALMDSRAPLAQQRQRTAQLAAVTRRQESMRRAELILRLHAKIQELRLRRLERMSSLQPFQRLSRQRLWRWRLQQQEHLRRNRQQEPHDSQAEEVRDVSRRCAQSNVSPSR